MDFWEEARKGIAVGDVRPGGKDAAVALRYDEARVGTFSLQPLVAGDLRMDTARWGRFLKVPAESSLEFWLKPTDEGKLPGRMETEVVASRGEVFEATAATVLEENGWTLYRADLGNTAEMDISTVTLRRGGAKVLLDGVAFRAGRTVAGVTDKPLCQWVAEAMATRPARVRAAIEEGTHHDFSGEMRQLFDRLWMGEEPGECNARLRELFREELLRMEQKTQDLWSLSLNVRLFQIYYELGSKSGRKPVALEPETEKLLLELLWRRTEHKNDIGWAFSNTWWMTGSENHDLNAKVTCLVSSRIFMNEPAYRDRLYPDAALGPGYGYWFHTIYGDARTTGPLTAAPWKPSGHHNADEHYRAWVAFFHRYLDERARRGFFLEHASPGYQKWSLGFLLALRRYGGDESLRAKLTSFLDLVWADWAIHQVGGLRGGPKTRHAHSVGGEDSMTEMGGFYLGGGGSTAHLLSMMVLDDYELPPVVFDLALDIRGRGRYAAVSRGVGEEEPGRPRPEGMERTLLTDTESRFLKYAWVTPDYILGTQMDHPDAVHSHLSAAGRWHGLIVAGHPGLRIVPHAGHEMKQDGTEGRGIDMEAMFLTAQDRNVLAGQQARRWMQISPGWFPSSPKYDKPIFLHVGRGWDEQEFASGWLWLRKGNAYAAVREVAARRSGKGSGPLDLRTDLPVEGSEILVQIDNELPPTWDSEGGSFALHDRFNPFIIHAGSRAEHGDFEGFRKAVLSARLQLSKTVVPGYYTLACQGACPEAREILFPSATPEIPRIGGQPLNYRPGKLFDNPFHQSLYGSGRHVIRKGEEEMVVDYAAPSKPSGSLDPAVRARFYELDRGPWRAVFEDPGTADWREKWFLDGEVATVENTPQGMEMTSGPESRNDAHHGVLWTKRSFEGDVKIEYDFTRLDSAREGVNILYVQATGSGEGPYAEDIAAWAELRKVPAMKMYYDHMHACHISYAVGYPGSEYVRLRRYKPEAAGLKGTEILPDYGKSDLFQTGTPYHMTLIKSGQEIFLRVCGGGSDVIHHWKNETSDPIVKGRIGLRQMWGKHSRYANFRVYLMENGGSGGQVSGK